MTAGRGEAGDKHRCVDIDFSLSFARPRPEAFEGPEIQSVRPGGGIPWTLNEYYNEKDRSVCLGWPLGVPDALPGATVWPGEQKRLNRLVGLTGGAYRLDPPWMPLRVPVPRRRLPCHSRAAMTRWTYPRHGV